MPVITEIKSSINNTKRTTQFKYSKVPIPSAKFDPETTVNRYSRVGNKSGVSRTFSGSSANKFGINTGTFKAVSAKEKSIRASNIGASTVGALGVPSANLGRRNTALATTGGNGSYKITVSRERKSMMVPPTTTKFESSTTRKSVNLTNLTPRKSVAAASTRKSVLAPITERKSFVSTVNNRKSTVGVSPSAAKFTSMNYNKTRETFKFTSTGKHIDNHDYVTGMRYSKIPQRGGAKNPYSQANPFPKSEIKSDRLKPGYREAWLKSLESKVPERNAADLSSKRKVTYERNTELISTPAKNGGKPYGDRSTAIKTTTIKKTVTKTTNKLDNKPKTSKFDLGISANKSIKESTIISNKVFE
jgi:hypothetical protein